MAIYNRADQKQKRRELRNDLTKAEVLLWTQLQGRKLLGHKFHRQYGIGPFIADFYCPALKLVIELDGDSHYAEGAREYDASREESMKSLGIRTVRVLNTEIFDNLDGVVEMIGSIVEELEAVVPGAREKRGRKRGSGRSRNRAK